MSMKAPLEMLHPTSESPGLVLTVSAVLSGVALLALTDIAPLCLQTAACVLARLGEAGTGHAGPSCGEWGASAGQVQFGTGISSVLGILMESQHGQAAPQEGLPSWQLCTSQPPVSAVPMTDTAPLQPFAYPAQCPQLQFPCQAG